VAANVHTDKFTGRSRLILSDEGLEAKIGEKGFSNILKTQNSELPANASDHKLVHRISQRLLGKSLQQGASKRGFQWEFKVLNVSEPNALALPSGKVRQSVL